MPIGKSSLYLLFIQNMKIQRIVALLNDLENIEKTRQDLLSKRQIIWLDYILDHGKSATRKLQAWKKICGKIQDINDQIILISKTIQNERQDLSYNHESSYNFIGMNLAY